jgi:hypothetical protein
MAHEEHLGEIQLLEHGGEVGRQTANTKSAHTGQRLAVAAVVDGNHAVSVSEIAKLMCPDRGIEQEPVKQHHHRARAAFDNMDTTAVLGFDEVVQEVPR